jgi:hypothetical protein
MTSQLNVDTIVDKAGSGGSNIKIANNSTYVSDGGTQTQSLVQGLSKSWNQCVGDGSAINDSFNVGSITDTATGRINVNLTNNMSNDDYSMVGSQGDDGRAQNCYSPSTSEYEAMTTLTSNQAAVDVALNCSSVLGDLA